MHSSEGTGLSFATRISLLYAFISTAWILLSDRAVATLFSGTAINDMQTIKGAGFVLLTTALIYIMMTREFHRRSQAESALREMNRELDGLVEKRTHELQQQAQVLRQSQQLYHLLVRNLPQITVLIYDHDLRHLIAEGQSLIEMGFDPQQLVGHTLFEVLTKDSADRLESLYRGALRGEEVGFDLNRYGHIFQVHSIPMRNEASEIEAGMIVSQDVTEERMAIQALARSQAMQEALIKNIPDGEIQLFDENLKFLIVGGKDLNFAGEKAIGKTLKEVMSDDLYRQLAPHYEAALKGGQHHFELKSEGHTYQIDTLPARLPDGQIINALALVRDITQRDEYERAILSLNKDLKKQRTQLINANQQLEAFSYSVSHDLRAPLRAIDGFSRVLLEKYKAQIPSDGQYYVERINHNAVRMGEMVESLLRLAGIGRLQIRNQAVDIVALCRQIIEEHEIRTNYPHARITIEADMPVCYGDEGLLYQVMNNLILNALKFSRNQPQPQVWIGCTVGETFNTYQIRDNGIGFDMAHADKLFRVFQRLHNEGDHPGIGAGLAIVQNIVHRHDGEIWAESQENAGSCFMFTIPNNIDHDFA